MTLNEFDKAVAALRDYLAGLGIAHRVSEQSDDHGRIREIGLWVYDDPVSTAGERGIVFTVHHPAWDGQIDRDRIARVLAGPWWIRSGMVAPGNGHDLSVRE